MRTRIFKIAGFCILAATLALAGDPWNQKKSSEWTPADARLVVTRSPWAVPAKLQCGNPLTCNVAPRPPEAGSQPHVQDGHPIIPPPIDPQTILDPSPVFLPGLSTCVGSEQVCNPPDREEKLQKTLEKMGTHPISEPMTVPPSLQATAIVLWENAAPVQTARTILGFTNATNHHAANSYVISVIGYPMQSALGQEFDLKQALPGGIKNVIQQSATLTPRGKHSIQATDVEVEGSGNAMNVRFFFPEDEAIKVDDKSAQFKMQVLLGDIVEATFNLKTMTYAGKPAISDSVSGAAQH